MMFLAAVSVLSAALAMEAARYSSSLATQAAVRHLLRPVVASWLSDSMRRFRTALSPMRGLSHSFIKFDHTAAEAGTCACRPRSAGCSLWNPVAAARERRRHAHEYGSRRQRPTTRVCPDAS